MDDHTPPAARPAREAVARFGRSAAPAAVSVSDAAGLDPALSQSLAAVMDRVAGVLEGQGRVPPRDRRPARRGRRAARSPVRAARGAPPGPGGPGPAPRAAPAALEAEARALRAENARLEEYVRRASNRTTPARPARGRLPGFCPWSSAAGAASFGRGGPPARPLQHPGPAGALMRSSQRAGRDVRLGGDRDGEHWALRAAVRDEEREQNLVFLLDETRDPQRLPRGPAGAYDRGRQRGARRRAGVAFRQSRTASTPEPKAGPARHDATGPRGTFPRGPVVVRARCPGSGRPGGRRVRRASAPPACPAPGRPLPARRPSRPGRRPRVASGALASYSASSDSLSSASRLFPPGRRPADADGQAQFQVS
jgi:hypothetical protein